MRTYHYLLAAAMGAAALFSSCTPPDENPVDGQNPIFSSATEGTVEASAEGDTCIIAYVLENPDENGGVEATSDAVEADGTEWIFGYDYSVDGKISFEVAANEAEESREATVTVTYNYPEGEEQSFSVKVVQAGMPAETMPDDEPYVLGHVNHYWSVFDLVEHNPDYSGSLLRDSVQTMVAAVEIEYNELAESCAYCLWQGDFSEMSYDDLYLSTKNAAQMAYKGDNPATLIFVTPGATSTLCSIAVDAEGNYGKMDIEYVTYTEEGKSMDFELYDEFYQTLISQ